ncbi:HAD family hydrolase [Velocimicrobium porci]|uniref:HAD family phosphatase n=1 Tax=Velocimicrobium porci TaxID=2606634 RepID=A0A6L5XYT2_9FIRM|nr:HAD family phosphatase [Velocimicrobium porci]MSS63621.1 HAD family phosphatase [Velocimicrobium porci]
MVHAVIFDMDGVLIDTEKYLVKYWCQAAKELGFEMKREHALLIRSLAANFAEAKLKELLGEQFDYKAVRSRRKELMSSHIKQYGLEKKRDVDQTLAYLKKKGYKTAVATASDFERTKVYLEQIGIYEKFDKVVCATMVQNGKPMPDIYLYACEQIGEMPENCVAVEDSPNGVLSASLAGLKTIMVPDLTKPDEETKKRIYWQIERLGDLTSLL